MTVNVEGTAEHGIATIWDADVLIWAASQIVEARDAGIPTSRLMRVTPYEILAFVGRGTSVRDYQRLKAALDRLQSTSVATSIRETTGRRLHRFSWINEWKECADAQGLPLGIELILPDWFYAGVSSVPGAHHRPGLLPIDRRNRALALPSGAQARRAPAARLEVRLLRHLHHKSGSLARFSDFALDVRRIAASNVLPGYALCVQQHVDGRHVLIFGPVPFAARLRQPTVENPGTSCELSRAIRRTDSRAIGRKPLVLSGAPIAGKASIHADFGLA